MVVQYKQKQMETRRRKNRSQLSGPKARPPISSFQKVIREQSSQVTILEIVFVFVLFLAFRLISAFFNNINDCDETFNYWEPAHFLLYKDGFQTWEYSPEYSIRSYFYLWLYIFPASLLKQFIADKIYIFYITRAYLSLVSALVETFFYSVIVKRFNRNVAKFYCFISLFAPGMFISSTAFLPSSFAQTTSFLSIGFWFLNRYQSFIFCTAFSAIVGWPFSVAISVPMALYTLCKRTFDFIFWSVVFGVPITFLTLLVDSYYYGNYVCASLNILWYNVFSSNGPELYGTEPFAYYLNNLFLNYNVVFIFSTFSFIPLLAVWYLKGTHAKNLKISGPFEQTFSIATLSLWFLIFSAQAHKEERFMYPIYPLISLSAAFTLYNIQQIVDLIWPKCRKIATFFIFSCLFVFFLLSVSRVVSLYKGYSASIRIYDKLADIKRSNLIDRNETILCLAKEWHRFPSNFFIPSSFRVEFIPSEFRGQLPKHFDFSTEFPTRIVPSHMNDQNKEEVSRYVSISSCDFIIDTDYSSFSDRDLPYSKDTANWSILYSLPFLDSSRSSNIFRAFYVPILSEKRCTYIDYNLLANKNTTFINL